MRRLPLYPEKPRLSIEQGETLDLNRECQRCELNRSHLLNPCLPADGYGYTGPGGLMVVTDFPYNDDDQTNRIMTSQLGGWVRREIEANWKESVVYDVAIRCAPGAAEVKPDYVGACQPYLRATYLEAKPSRVLCFGPQAARGILGRTVDPRSSRRGYAYSPDGTIVFILPSAYHGATNRFVGKMVKEDIKWALTATPKQPPWDAFYNLVETAEDAERAVEALRAARWWSFDTETAGRMWDGRDGYFEVFTFAACPSLSTEAWVWPQAALDSPETFSPLANLLQDRRSLKSGQNLKYDVEVMPARRGQRVRVNGMKLDTMLMAKMRDSDALGRLAYQVEKVGMGGMKEENDAQVDRVVEEIKYLRAMMAKGLQPIRAAYPKYIQAAMDMPDVEPEAFAYGGVEAEVRERYCARDIVGTSLLADDYAEVLEENPRLALLNNEYMAPATATFAQIEAWGMSIDRNSVQEVKRFLEMEIDRVLKQLKEVKEIEPSKDAQVRAFLYEELGLTPPHFTDKSNLPSVDSAALKLLEDKHPAIPLIREFKTLDKLRGTYAVGLLKHIRGDGRIHSNFNLDGTRTGRLSARDPNLLNMPSRGKLAKLIKRCFIAPPGWCILQLDYSQIELRIAAILAGDEVLGQVFRDGLDVHRRTAELVAPIVYGVPTAEAELMSSDDIKPWRDGAKIVNFALLYGKSVESLAKEMKCSVEVAQKLSDAVWGQFANVARWVAAQKQHVNQYGWVDTYHLGPDGPVPLRRRNLFEIAGGNSKAQGTAMRGSFNTPPQGTASDCMIRSIIRVVSWILATGVPARVTNSVYDSMILECRLDAVDYVAPHVKAIMEDIPSMGVPLIADMDVGRTWGDLVGVEKTANGWSYKKKVGDSEEVVHIASLQELVA